MIKKIKYILFLIVLGYIFIPKDTYAYEVQAYWASQGWQVQGICQDSQCNGPTGAYVENPSYHCLTILGIEFMGEYKANHRYHNEVRITIPSSNSVAPWQNLTDMQLGFNPYNQTSNFNRTTITPASPANPQYYPTNWLYRTYDLSYDIVNNSNFNKFGYYFYFNDNNCQQIGGVIIQSYSTTDLDGDKDPNDSIIQNQNKNTSDIINNQNQNQAQTNDKLDSIGDDLTDINDSITDDTPPSTSDFEDFVDDIEGDTGANPLGSLMTLPITFVNTMYGQFSTQIDDGCERIKLMSFTGPWFDDPVDIYLPCFDGQHFFGSTWWNIIDLLICFTMFYNIVMLFVHVWEDISTLSLDTGANASITGTPTNSPYGRR